MVSDIEVLISVPTSSRQEPTRSGSPSVASFVTDVRKPKQSSPSQERHERSAAPEVILSDKIIDENAHLDADVGVVTVVECDYTLTSQPKSEKSSQDVPVVKKVSIHSLGQRKSSTRKRSRRKSGQSRDSGSSQEFFPSPQKSTNSKAQVLVAYAMF